MERKNIEIMRSREKFAVGSVLELNYLGEPLSDDKNRIVERIVMPYIMYGPVLVSELDIWTDSSDGDSEFSKAIYLCKSKELCIDMHSVFSSKELEQAAELLKHDAEWTALRNKFIASDYKACAAMAATLIYKERRKLTKDEWVSLWRERMSRVCNELSFFGGYDRIVFPDYLEDADVDYMQLFHEASACRATCKLETEKERIAALGKRPISTHYDRESFKALAPSEMNVFEFVVPNICIPDFESFNDLVEFVKQDEYQKPLRNLRGFANNLVVGKADLYEIKNTVDDSIRALEKAVSRETRMIKISDFKLVFGGVAGLVEDIIKLRFEKMATRPFEVAEGIIKRLYDPPAYEGDPLFVLRKIKDRFCA